ncbi:MAG: hypothetical protein HQK86_05025 [Nitrospinae bacterium]|nr:hypothetical protein [Nitrospinota bacterium]
MKTALAVIGATVVLGGAAMAQSASEWAGQMKLGGVVSQSSGAGSSPARPDAAFFEDPSKASPLAYRLLYETAGFLGGKHESFGTIQDGENSEQTSFSAVDVVHINRTIGDGLRAGDKYLVFHPDSKEVVHPVSRKSLGHKVFIDGVIEVIEPGEKFSKAKITKSFNPIQRGYRIKQYEENKIPSIDMDKPVVEKKVEGIVVASKDLKSSYATGDVIYIDIGQKAGVEVGDLLELVANRKSTAASPEKTLGRARVLALEDETATAVIVTSVQMSRIGDTVRYIQDREVVSPVMAKGGKK